MCPSASISIKLEYLENDGVWLATSDDVPGLFVESRTQEELMKAVTPVVMEMLNLMGDERARQHPTFDFSIIENG